MNGINSNVRQLRPCAPVPDSPPAFVATDTEGDLPGDGQYMVRVLAGRVVIAYRANPWESWGRPVTAVLA